MRAGRRPQATAVTPGQRAAMRREYDGGATLRQIADRYELAPSTVYHHVRRDRGRVVREPDHGTQAGWMRHYAAETEPCEPCAASHGAYLAGQAMMAADA